MPDDPPGSADGLDQAWPDRAGESRTTLVPVPDRSLTLLYVGRVPPLADGTAIVGGQLLVGLQRRGHRMHTLAPTTAGVVDAEDRRMLVGLGIDVVPYPVPTFPTSLPDGALDLAYRRIEREQIRQRLPLLLERARPHVILSGLESIGPHVLDIAAEHRVPSVQLVHGGRMLGRRLAGEDPPGGLVAALPKATRLVTVAHHLARSLAMGGFDAEVIPNPVDLERFRPGPEPEGLRRALDLTSEHRVVLHVSNLRQLKRAMDLVLSAATAVREDPRLVYVIVGDGQTRAALERACRASGLGSYFRFVGSIAHARVPDYLKLADLVVMPSETEGQSLVCLEAQACGRLVLASDIPGAHELICDGETGLLFRMGDVEDLAVKTLRAARDPSLRAAIGIRARASVAGHATPDIMARYEAMLRAVAERHPAGTR